MEDKGNISDGYHTFNRPCLNRGISELYEHRHLLFIALMKSNPSISWRANNHSDGTMYEGGWFVAGMHLTTGDITYHLPNTMWELLDGRNIETTNLAPKWDGHTPVDVIDILIKYLNNG